MYVIGISVLFFFFRYGSKLIIDEEMTAGQLLIVRKLIYLVMFVKNKFVSSNVAMTFVDWFFKASICVPHF